MMNQETMTNKEAIKEIEKLDDWISKQSSLLEDWLKTSEALDKAIQALEQTRWIPVSSGKLPDEQTHVIVTIGNERFTSVQLCLYTSTSIFWKEYVKAWMPLPPSYQEEEKSEDAE